MRILLNVEIHPLDQFGRYPFEIFTNVFQSGLCVILLWLYRSTMDCPEKNIDNVIIVCFIYKQVSKDVFLHHLMALRMCVVKAVLWIGRS